MPTTPVQALPYPALSDPANGPVAMQNLALALEDYKTLVRCTSSTRPAHVEGRLIYETDTDVLAVSNGTAWQPLIMGAWKTYTPTLVSGTVGTGVGSLVGRYAQHGKTIHYEVRWILGTGYVFNSNTLITTPTTRTNPSIYGTNIVVKYTDSPAGNLFQGIGLQWSTGVSCYWHGTSGIASTIQPTSPFTWTVGDEVYVAGTYEAS